MCDLDYRELIGVDETTPLSQKIIDVVCSVLKITFEQLKDKSREQKLVRGRQIIMTLLNSECNFSLSESAAVFNKDHATCLHAKKTISNIYDTDRDFRKVFDKIKTEIFFG